jgi:hypothetical protein
MTAPKHFSLCYLFVAVPGQRGQGIHLRLRARSFAVNDNNKMVTFVSVDGGMHVSVAWACF